MTKRDVQELENEAVEGKTARAKRAQKTAQKTRKKTRKKINKIAQKKTPKKSGANLTKTTQKTAVKKPLSESQKQLILLLSENYGTKTVTDICEQLKISRNTYHNWIKEHPEILEAVSDGFDNKLEYLEFLLLEAAQAGDLDALKYLHTSMLKSPYAHARRRFFEAQREFNTGADVSVGVVAPVVISLGSGEQPEDDNRDLSTILYIQDAEVIE